MSSAVGDTGPPSSPKKKLGRSRYFPSVHVEDSAVRFVTTSTPPPPISAIPNSAVKPPGPSTSGSEGFLQRRMPAAVNGNEGSSKDPALSLELPAPSSSSEGVPAHLLLKENDDEVVKEEEDDKPDILVRFDAANNFDDLSGLFEDVKQEPLDDGVKHMDVVSDGDFSSTSSAPWGGVQRPYVTSNETEILFCNMPSDTPQSSGLFRRMCMKCQQTVTYDRRTEWATLSDHALQHIRHKARFHCLMCEFATTTKARIHSHMKMNHYAMWVKGCQGDEDPVAHPCCDSPDDIIRIEDIIFQCFPGVLPKSLALPDPDDTLEEPHDVTHYLITFDDVEPLDSLSPPLAIPVFANRPRVLQTIRSTCSSCLQDVGGVDLRQEQLKHVLSVHSDFGTACNLCYQKIRCPTNFVKHSVDKHNSQAELIHRPLDHLKYYERQKVEDMARQFFNPRPLLISKNLHAMERGLLPVKTVPTDVANRVRCKRCKIFVENVEKTKGEHALLHTEFSGISCSLCPYKVMNLDAFLFHNTREHYDAARIFHRTLADLTPQEAFKVTVMTYKLFEPVPRTNKSGMEEEEKGELIINSMKLKKNQTSEPLQSQNAIPANIKRESAFLDGQVTINVGRMDHPAAKRPRILRQAKKRHKYFEME